MKRRILSVLCCLVLLSVLPVAAFAAAVPDLDRTGSISITMTYQGEAVPGGFLTLYQVAQVHAPSGGDYSYRYTQPYEDCQVSLTNIGSSDTAQKLAEYTAQKGISGTKIPIDEKGNVRFQNLELGLYLLIQQDAADGFEPVSPFLVSVPGREDGRYLYDVDASPKLSLERIPTEPTQPPTEPTVPPPDLPQTGMTQWPIPVLAISGLLLVVVGLALYNSGRKKHHES